MAGGFASTLFVWAALVAGGGAVLLWHDGRAGSEGAPAAAWPGGAGLVAPEGRPLLLMLVHSQCPCTRASLDQLRTLLARAGERVEARLLVYTPAVTPPHWEQGALDAALAALPGVQQVADVDGALAARLGLQTSGHVLLYSPDGRLLFSGGLTPSRSHRGDSAGLSAALDIALGRPPARRESPVYGCPIGAPADGGS